MKQFVFLVMMVLCMSSFACAEVMEFRYFSLDVPEGWSVNEDGNVITVTAADKSGSLSITADNPGGKTIAELAEEYSRRLNGTAPEEDEEGGYTFEFNNGVSQAAIDGDEDLYLLIIGTGIERNGDVLSEILESLEMK
ncbi:MAG: hypothetical protein IJS28_08940 [Synergistaceae bacterium]|nr:hypothetical protein [Synergistaceae bacterium]